MSERENKLKVIFSCIFLIIHYFHKYFWTFAIHSFINYIKLSYTCIHSPTRKQGDIGISASPHSLVHCVLLEVSMVGNGIVICLWQVPIGESICKSWNSPIRPYFHQQRLVCLLKFLACQGLGRKRTFWSWNTKWSCPWNFSLWAGFCGSHQVTKIIHYPEANHHRWNWYIQDWVWAWPKGMCEMQSEMSRADAHVTHQSCTSSTYCLFLSSWKVPCDQLKEDEKAQD